jgi:hypothetical protein
MTHTQIEMFGHWDLAIFYYLGFGIWLLGFDLQ